VIFYENCYREKYEIITLLDNKDIRLEKLGRLIIYGEFKRFDKVQEKYKQFRSDKYINRTFGNELTMYKEKYNLRD
jgi:hypothetical protein